MVSNDCCSRKSGGKTILSFFHLHPTMLHDKKIQTAEIAEQDQI